MFMLVANHKKGEFLKMTTYKHAKALLCIMLCIFSLAHLAACSAKEPAGSSQPALTSVWEQATYKEDTTLGQGSKTITVKVIKDGSTITFTLKTDSQTLGDVLLDTKLIEGDKGPYGLYINKVNGISAIYEQDKAYWSIMQNGKALMSGVDSINISGGECFELVYTKA